MKLSKGILLTALLATCGVFLLAPNVKADDAEKTFTIKVNNVIDGDTMTGDGITYELQKIEDMTITTISSKTSNRTEEISFDPLTFDATDSNSHFYRIVQKNNNIPGLTPEEKIIYARIVPSKDLLAYQDDTTYQYVNDGSGPHPYHATDEELQGQAYAVYDSDTKTLTFFRDEAGKYLDRQQDGNKKYYTDFELANRDHPNSYQAAYPSWSYYSDATVAREAETVIFEDAIRPEGAMSEWFSNFKKVKRADISKLDTSLATTLDYFFYQAIELSDIDITTLDFSGIARTIEETNIQSLSHFMKWTGLTEFDFNNYYKLNAPSRPVIGEMLLDANLRYLNTSNLFVEASSSEFNGNYCLERLVVGEGFTFYRSNLDYQSGPWLKIETNKIGLAARIISTEDGVYVGSVNPNGAGNYVRPTCNITPATFTNTYHTPSADEKNPNTADSIALTVILLASSGIIAVSVLRFKRR